MKAATFRGLWVHHIDSGQYRLELDDVGRFVCELEGGENLEDGSIEGMLNGATKGDKLPEALDDLVRKAWHDDILEAVR